MKMKNLMIIGLLCLTFFAGQVTFAQDTAKSELTLTETLEFIEGKLPSLDNAGSNWTDWKPLFKHKNSQDGNRNFYTEGYDSFTFEGTKLKILTRYRQYRTDKTDVSQEFKGGCENSTEIELKDIDPSSIKTGQSDYGYYWVKIRTTGDKKTIKSRQFNCSGITEMYLKVDPFIVRETWTQKDTQSLVAEFTFTALDEETSNKIAKALTHAVKLSGGKEEPF